MSFETAALSMAKEVEALVKLIQQIKDALGTDENGAALIEVARNAHRAEMELASLTRKVREAGTESEMIEAISELLP